MIPLGATISWRHGRHRRFAVWIPLFAIWLLLLPLVLVLFPLICVACLYLRVSAVQLYVAAWRILASLRHTLIEVQGPDHALRIHIA